MQDRTIRHVLQALAVVVALVIQIVIPVGFALIRTVDSIDSLQFKSRISSARAAKYIFANSELWEFQASRLSEIIELPTQDYDNFRQSVITADGSTAYSDENVLPAPVIAHREPLIVSGKQVGTLIVETSLRTIMVQTGVIAFIAFLLAALSYMTINRWPLRLLDRTLHDLASQQARTDSALRQLELTDAKLRERTGQLIHAQELGQIGDWSLQVGTENLFLSPVALSLLRINPDQGQPQWSELAVRLDGDGVNRMDAMISDVVRNGSMRTIDLRIWRNDNMLADMAVSCQVAERSGKFVTLIRGTVQDVTARKDAERQLERLAYFDPLTGLANRSMFQRELNEAVERSRQAGHASTLLLIDLDRFKEVNDSLGHATGDELLVKVSQILCRIVPKNQFIARLGGDEFAIILADMTERSTIEAISQELVDVLSKPIALGRSEAVIGASIGIAFLPEHGSNGDEVNKNADLALYRAKDLGRGRYAFFEKEMNEVIQHKMALARDLRVAAGKDGGLEAWLQPQIGLATGGIVGFEALMRWNHPVRGFIPPSDFIPIAESSSLICEIGLWIMRESARKAKEWIDAGGHPCEIAVNISAAQIWQTNLEQDVAKILEETGLPPHLLCLELTESLLADHAEGRVRKALNGLKALGVQLSLDDFGTGFSSLGYLIQLPFDKLKIDRVFVAEAPRSAKARQVLQGIVALGHGLGMTVLAEGVERPEELALLKEFGCDQAQGYMFARPAPAAAAFAFAVQARNDLAMAAQPAKPKLRDVTAA